MGRIFKFGIWFLLTILVSAGTSFIIVRFFNGDKSAVNDLNALSNMYQVVIGFLTVIIGILGFIVYKNSIVESRNYIDEVYKKDKDEILEKALNNFTNDKKFIKEIGDKVIKNDEFMDQIVNIIDWDVEEKRIKNKKL
jgi:hypothetical protein